MNVPHLFQRPLSKLKTFLNSLNTPLVYWLVVLVIILVGLGLRGYRWQSHPFGFDQLQIIENAQKITHGDLSLIGPRTGPAPMFTGPLIYYIGAIFVAILPAPYIVPVGALAIALATGLVVFILSHAWWGKQWALVLVSLWAVSPLLVVMDRVFWNPNLTVLAAVCCLFPILEIIKKNRSTWFQLAALFSGGFFGYQAHFSGVVLPVLVTLSLIATWKKRWEAVLAVTFGLLVSLMPTLIFDLRYDWFNLKGLLVVAARTGGTSLTDRFLNMGEVGVHVSQIWGQALMGEYAPVLLAVLGLANGLLLIWHSLTNKQKAEQAQLRVLTVWVVVTIVGMSIYNGNKPEYYYLLLVPVFLWWFAYVLTTWTTSKLQIGMWLSLLAITSAGGLIYKYQTVKGVELGNVLQASRDIRTYATSNPVKEIVYDTDEIHAMGLKYLLSDFPLQPEGRTVHIQYPYYLGTLTSKHYQDLGLWIDPRVDQNSEYLTKPTYIIRSTKPLKLFQDFSPNPAFEGNETFLVMLNQQPVGQLVVWDRNRDVKSFERITDQIIREQSANQETWQTFHKDGQLMSGYWARHYLLLYLHQASDNQSLTADEVTSKLGFIYQPDPEVVHQLGPSTTDRDE